MIRMSTFLSIFGVFVLCMGCSSTIHQRYLVKHQMTVLTNSTNLDERRDAAFELSTYNNINKKMISTLIEAANDRDTIIREFMIRTIGRMNPEIDGVVRAIQNGLKDSVVSVRRTSAAIFSTMSPVPTAVLRTLAEALCDQDSLLRTYVTSTFIDLGAIGVNALVYACKHSNNSLRYSAATTLGIIGYEAKRALPALKELLQDKNAQVRDAARQSISLIESSMPYSNKS